MLQESHGNGNWNADRENFAGLQVEMEWKLLQGLAGME